MSAVCFLWCCIAGVVSPALCAGCSCLCLVVSVYPWVVCCCPLCPMPAALWCCLLCSVLVLCVVFALVCSSLRSSSYRVYISSWPVSLPGLYLVVAGLYLVVSHLSYVTGRRVAARRALCCPLNLCVLLAASGLCVLLRLCCLVSFVCCLRVSASCAVLLSLCCVSRRTVSRASSLVWPALLCARSVRRVCSRVTRCALCCVYICSWSVYLPGLSLVVAGLHPFLICISFWPVSSSLRLHLVLVCISPRSVSRRCWSASLPGLCIFLVCISSLRLHLVLICISISPCLYLVVASLSLRLYG